MLTCKITLPDSPHPVIISKNPGFRALFLARQNKFCFFVQQIQIFFSFWLLASVRKFSFCPKKDGFAQVCGLQPPAPGSYAYDN